MKKQAVIKATLSLILCFWLSNLNAQTEKLPIDTSKSEIKWIGEYAFYFGGHEGVIDFKDGHFIKTGELITGGEFTIDMNTISSTDMEEPEARADLDKHLKNEDFFQVDKYPEAKLVIKRVRYENPKSIKVFADLTIKDITRPINFLGNLDFEKQQMTTKFKIDRTLWGITYSSKEIEGKFKDGLISDAVGFEVLLSL
ncbi:MAG: YceI family protein [Bacteroidota bacterium]